MREVRLLLRLADGCVCLVRPVGSDGSLWGLPGCRLGARDAPERVAVRHCVEALGLEGLALVPQPVREIRHGSHVVRWHVFCANVPRDEALPLGYREVRWAAAQELAGPAVEGDSARILADLRH